MSNQINFDEVNVRVQLLTNLWKGILIPCRLSHKYHRSGNPITIYKQFSVIYKVYCSLSFWGRISKMLMKMLSGSNESCTSRIWQPCRKPWSLWWSKCQQIFFLYFRSFQKIAKFNETTRHPAVLLFWSHSSGREIPGKTWMERSPTLFFQRLPEAISFIALFPRRRHRLKTS